MSPVDRTDARGEADVHNGTIMPTDARCLVETAESSATVRLTGVLDRAGVDAVRGALLGRLWARPGPMVVDLSGVRIPDPQAREALDEVGRAVADWPATDLLFVSGDRPVPRPADAPPELLDVELLPVVEAAREARALVTDGCARWGLPELAEPACIAVTEMVNNVVAHAATPMTLRLAPRGGALHVAVRDHAPGRPTYAGPAPVDSVGGRGLLLIDVVARRWGSTPLPDGKVVWCVLHAEDEAAFRN
ncbi:Histidine kinase-like ATPase domain-containing protein [Micromonospora sediminicola]|uniref:Histidine kinase-like ATPase domain-containing protein n=2 Tax=Micromonospora sediminicola TaxID=946078 RepID=A0A1A9B4Y6_9ACTN|nr:Histidine kinase-like ATPase domain-containing protein [Micromonospora sediminicola]